jgi:hypothetical protein
MIESKHDIIVTLPPTAFRRPARGTGWFNGLRKLTGFGRTVKVKTNVTDVNGDGRTILQVACPLGVEAVVRRANGERVTTIDSISVAKDVKIDVAGEIIVTFKEVRYANV